MSFLNKLKSKVQGVLDSNSQSSGGHGSSSSNAYPGSGISNLSQQQAWTHNSQQLNFSAAHLRSQNPSIPQPPPADQIGIQQTKPWPPKLQSHTYHPPMKFLSPSGQPHAVMRDLGFSSVIGGRIVWTWGDTLMGTSEQCMICAVDSTSIGTLDSKEILLDSALAPGTSHVANWIDCLPHEEADGGLTKYAFGGTNIIEYPPNSGRGVVYYLKNSRPGGQNKIVGAGIATVHIDEENIPHSRRCGDTLWNEFEPWYGDVGAVLNTQDNYIYAYGHGPAWDSELSSRTFLARVPADKATDLSAYSYWRNTAREWTSQRQANGHFGTALLTQQDAIFDWNAMNQSVPFWSVYFGKWMFVHGSAWPDSEVLVKTADQLEGPWEDHGGVCSTAPRGDEKGFRYCICPHPEYDASGKTVWVTWTRENVIYGVTLEWE